MGRLGFFGANLEGYGCAGMSNVEYGLIMQELERADSGMRSFASVQGALVMYPILTYGSEEQKQRWLPKLANGRGARLLRVDRAGIRIESGGHADAGARERAASWVIDGEKTWITNGSVADVAVVWARTEDGIRGFLVEKGTPGFSVVGTAWKAFDAGVGDGEPCVRELPRSGERDVAGRERAQGAARLPDAGAVRDRLGSDRRRDGLLRDCAILFGAAQAVRRSADRLASTGAGKAGGYDHGDHQGAVAGACTSGG